MTELKALPLLKDTPPEQREQLFLAKLQICSIVFNFDDPESNLKGKEIKRMTLLELVDFVNSVPEQKAYLANEALMKPLMDMIVSRRTVPSSRALPQRAGPRAAAWAPLVTSNAACRLRSTLPAAEGQHFPDSAAVGRRLRPRGGRARPGACLAAPAGCVRALAAVHRLPSHQKQGGEAAHHAEGVPSAG